MPEEKPLVLGLVPARSGSKGFPGKNVHPLDGHPLLAYSVAAGVQSPRIDRVVCSTDSEEYAAVAKRYGADAPFLRPRELAADASTDVEVFTHALNFLAARENYRPDLVVVLRPTSPIRYLEDIERAIDLLIGRPDADSVRSVSAPTVTPYKMWRVGAAGELVPLLQVPGVKDPYNAPRQSLPQVWQQTGTIDVTRARVILEKKSMTGDLILPLQIDDKDFVDIDNKRDLDLASLILRERPCVRPAPVPS